MSNAHPVLNTLKPWLERSRETLGTILSQDVAAGEPSSSRVAPTELEALVPPDSFSFPLTLSGAASGQALLTLSHSDAAMMVDLLSGGDGGGAMEDLTELHVDVLAEAVQQITSTLPRIFSEFLREPVRVNLNEPHRGEVPDLGAPAYVLLRYPLQLSSAGDFTIHLVLPEALAEKLSPLQDPPPPRGRAEARPEPEEPAIQPARFEPVETSRRRASDVAQLDTILDVPLQVTVVLGRTSVLLEDLVTLGEGSVLELDKLAGEPVELYVHDRLVAYGEVIVIDERFGVKIVGLAEDRSPQAQAARGARPREKRVDYIP